MCDVLTVIQMRRPSSGGSAPLWGSARWLWLGGQVLAARGREKLCALPARRSSAWSACANFQGLWRPPPLGLMAPSFGIGSWRAFHLSSLVHDVSISFRLAVELDVPVSASHLVSRGLLIGPPAISCRMCAVRMRGCVHVCTVCMHVCMHICVHSCNDACMHGSIHCMSARVHLCMCTYVAHATRCDSADVPQ